MYYGQEHLEWTDKFVFIPEKDVKRGDVVCVGLLKGVSGWDRKAGVPCVAICKQKFDVFTGILLIPPETTIPLGTPLYSSHDRYLTFEPTGDIVAYTYRPTYEGDTVVTFYLADLQVKP